MEGYDFSQVQVLIVDDNRHMISIVRGVLQSFGIKQTFEAVDAAEAFEEFRRNTIDVVITDFNMEPLDGIDFVRLIRTAKDSPNTYVPIIMLTAFSEHQRVVAAREAGVTEFLTKPVKPRDLYLRLYQIIEHPRPFIRTKNFFGPDRRRNEAPSYSGPYRRSTDSDQKESAEVG